jgi:hypothetical protein
MKSKYFNYEGRERYFQFPLCLLQNILIHPSDGINLIINYSIVNFAKKLNYSLHDVKRQLIYDYYRNHKSLHSSLQKSLRQYVLKGRFTNDEDYNGFDGNGDFNPELNTGELDLLFKENVIFAEEAIFHYQLYCAAQALNVEFGNVNYHIEQYEKAKNQIFLHENKYGKDPTPGLKTQILFEFRDKKNYEEIELLCAVAAIRSLKGKHEIIKTYKNVILMRMIGARTKDILNDLLTQPKLKEVYAKYSNRYWMDKLLKKARDRKFIQSKIGIDRCIYIGITHDMEHLEKAVINIRNKKKLPDKQEKEARKRILALTNA